MLEMRFFGVVLGALAMCGCQIGVPVAASGPSSVKMGSSRAKAKPSARSKGGIDMVRIPAGSFGRGSETGDEDEKPVRRIFLDEFWIDTYEVTVGQYKKCVNARACTKPSDTASNCSDRETNNWLAKGRDEHPVNCVNWSQARKFCTWARKRLPTEAEWEKAARSDDARTWPWGEDAPSCEWAVVAVDEGAGCGRGHTWPVGKKPAGKSPYGVHDLVGNVVEWVADVYGEDYYPKAPVRNPKGPRRGEWRGIRGDNWSLTLIDPVSRRFRRAPDNQDTDLGFRCAR